MGVTINIPYSPNPKQAMFHASRANECLFGGAAGPGKTCGAVMDALSRCLNWPGSIAVIFRRTYRELEDTVITESKKWYPPGIGKYNASHHEWVLINGSKISFRHCGNMDDAHTYQGLQVDWLYFDELTHFEFEMYDYIKTRIRTTNPDIIPIVRCTSNPGGIGHMWVKKMFVDAGPPYKLIEGVTTIEATGEKRRYTKQYIPALVMDNPHITKDYIFELERKPKALRDALLYGNWDAFEGQVFEEWVDLCNKRDKTSEEKANLDARKWTHVIKPFTIPLRWPRLVSFDHGYSRPFSVGWWAIGPRGEMYRYREWYGCEPNQPNAGIKLSPQQISKGILERETEEARENLYMDRYADPAIFDKSRGVSVAEAMEPVTNDRGHTTIPGVIWGPGDNTRMAGLMQFHERLRFNADGYPMMQVFDTCRDFIRTIPMLPYDPKKPEDVDTDAEDHCYDEVRMALMARKIPVNDIERKPTPAYDPYRSNKR